MSKAITPIDLDLNKQQLLDHSNPGFLSPLTFSPRKPSSSSSFTYKCNEDDNNNNGGSSIAGTNQSTGPVIDEDDDEIVDCDTTNRSTIYNSSWLFSNDHLQLKTPSRRDGISYVAELDLRRNGTTFIRDLAKLLKLKPICKETAYVYFHRFYMLRSFKQFEPTRISMACLYFACKFEDHPTFKEHMVKVSYFSSKNEKLNKEDKKYIELCDQLICDENLLLQTLGFHLQVRHSQVIIVEASQRRIQGTTQELYTSAYQIASEMNRLSMLCLEFNCHLLACVAIYLTAYYKRVTLPNDWYTTIIAQATGKTLAIVTKIAESYKDVLAKHSQIIKKMINESAIRESAANKSNSQQSLSSSSQQQQHSASKTLQNSGRHGSQNRHSSTTKFLFPESTNISQHFINNFSPDSAYSSCSSTQSPQESLHPAIVASANRLPIIPPQQQSANGGGGGHYNNSHNNAMMNYHQQSGNSHHHQNQPPHPQQKSQYPGMIPQLVSIVSSSNCYANSTSNNSSNIYNSNSSSSVVPNKPRSGNTNNNNHHNNNTLQQQSYTLSTNNNNSSKRNISQITANVGLISNHNNNNKKLKPNNNNIDNYSSCRPQPGQSLLLNSKLNNNGYPQQHHHTNSNSSASFIISNSMKFNVPSQQQQHLQQQMMAQLTSVATGDSSSNHHPHSFYHHSNSSNNNNPGSRRSMTQF